MYNAKNTHIQQYVNNEIWKLKWKADICFHMKGTVELTIIVMKPVENGFYCVNNRIKLKLFAFRKTHSRWDIL